MDTNNTTKFVYIIAILLLSVAGSLCCCYINPLMCQQIRHRQKIIPINESKEEEPPEIIINPMNFVIIV